MRHLCLLLTMFIACTVAASAQQCKEYAPAGGVFAFCPPDGWSSTQEKDRKYLTFEKKVAPNVFPPSLMIDEEKGQSNVPFEVYVFGMVQGLFVPTSGPGKVTNKRVSDMTEFKTTSGIKGIKLVTEMSVDSIPTRTVYYVFEAPGPVILTFVAMSGDDDAVARAVETAMKSLRAKR